ncbi:hypothetical protein EVAR_7697_1 [Eumeta japonica]|uniref:Uncharacterized protein n=1 Tax=Eumeta variegata TaxID=151549 RepID=A0A4C1TLL6_EUMVA|nr:hypothetical protein EVAR_7697_1 [Eumeta japonica]
MIEDNITTVRLMIETDKRVTYHQIQTSLGIGIIGIGVASVAPERSADRKPSPPAPRAAPTAAPRRPRPVDPSAHKHFPGGVTTPLNFLQDSLTFRGRDMAVPLYGITLRGEALPPPRDRAWYFEDPP